MINDSMPVLEWRYLEQVGPFARSNCRFDSKIIEIREDNFRFGWRRVHEDASQGMYMSKIEILFFYILQCAAEFFFSNQLEFITISSL
jgi:hypothetical protein